MLVFNSCGKIAQRENALFNNQIIRSRFYRVTITFPELALPLSCGTGNGGKGSEGSGNDIDRVTVYEGEAQVSYHV